MPGTDLTIVSSAVTSAKAEIQLEPEEKIVASNMTQSQTPEEETLTRTQPSKDFDGCIDENSVRKAADYSTQNNWSMDTKTPGSVTSKTSKSASCGSLSAHTLTDGGLHNSVRRVSAEAVNYSRVKDESTCEFSNEKVISNKNIECQNEKFNPLSRFSHPEQARSLNAQRVISPNKEDDKSDDKLGEKGRLNELHVTHQAPMFTAPVLPMERKYECEKCGVSFHRQNTYLIHVKHYCSGKRHDVECGTCGAKFDSKKRLSIHMEVHDPQYLCLICTERFTLLEDCKNHMVQHVDNCDAVKKSDSDTIPCPGCDTVCSRRTNLIDHLWTNHITIGNGMPYLYHCPLSPSKVSSPKKMTGSPTSHKGMSPRNIDSDPIIKSDRATRDISVTPPRSHLYDGDLQLISPPITTSTPSRPTSTQGHTRQTTAFSCIVCSLVFPDVVELQHHLLTSHASVGSRKPASQVRLQADTPFEGQLQKTVSRHKGRKMSTVSPPKLSLLSGPVPRKMSENILHLGVTGRLLEEQGEERDNINAKKRKERNSGESNPSDEQYQASSLKRIKRDMHPSNNGENKFLSNEKFESRRISCPVVSSKLLGGETCDTPPVRFSNQSPIEDRTCVQCDIKFSSAVNFRAHKKYYCATRHIHKVPDDDRRDFLSVVNQTENPDVYELTNASKLRKRNVGNRSSITSRKRSHLTPLETVPDISPSQEPVRGNKLPSNRKSCPSEVGSFSNTDAGNNSTSPEADPTDRHAVQAISTTKKHLCQECNIWYSKYDTYMAHKKYYCESRRKDRGGQRVLSTSSKVSLKRKSESSLREPIVRPENPILSSDHRRWSPHRTTPSTDGDEERRVEQEDTDSTSKETQNPTTFENGSIPFSAYGQTSIMNHEVLARLSFMHYLAMMRSQEICTNGFLFPTLQAMNLPTAAAVSSSSSTTKIHRRSVADLRTPVSKDGAEFGGINRHSTPATRRFSEAHGDAIRKELAVKQEPIEDFRYSADTTEVHPRGSPLDLSNKNVQDSSDGDSKSRPEKEDKIQDFPYPTIDLRTTALAFIKREPNQNLTATNSNQFSGTNNTSTTNNVNIRGGMDQDPKRSDCSTGSNNNNNNNMISSLTLCAPAIAVCQSQEGAQVLSQKSRAQQCKNCNARFTSLSTFIAHKKYYCSASNSNGLHCNDAKAAQMAH